MKKVILCFVIFAMLFISFCGCKTPPVLGISQGIYTCKQESDSVFYPSIKFDLEDSSFVFSYDPLSSYLPMGNIEIKNGRVIAKTSDRKYTYVFDIIDNDTIRFKEKSSSEIKMTDGKSVVSDGCEFVFTEQ